MSIPKSKEELMDAIETSYSKLKEDLETIPPQKTLEKTLEGHAKGTQMSISNLVAYLIGWGELVLKWHQKKEHNQAVDFPETGYKWNELGKLAQKFYADYEDLKYHTLLLKLEATKTEIMHLIAKTSSYELYEKPWYDKWPLGKMIQLNTSSPYKNARTRVRKWKKQYAESKN